MSDASRNTRRLPLLPGPKLRARYERAIEEANERASKADEVRAVFEEAYLRRPWIMEERDRAEIGETYAFAPWAHNLQRDRNRILLTGVIETLSPLDRQYELEMSRKLYARQGNARGIIRTWTNYGFGIQLALTVHDKRKIADAQAEAKERQDGVSRAHAGAASAVMAEARAEAKAQADKEVDAMYEWWDEFWNAKRNRPYLSFQKRYRLSDWLLRDGEYLFVLFTNKSDGASTLRIIKADEIGEILTSEEDEEIPLFYKREWVDSDGKDQSMYYRDWMLPPPGEKEEKSAVLLHGDPEDVLPEDAVRADEQDEDTDVVAMHVAFETIDGRGQPILSTVSSWLIEYDQYARDLMAVAKQNAMWVRRLEHAAGSRATDALKSLLDSTLVTNPDEGLEQNPPPVAGSTFIHNKAVTPAEMPLSRAATMGGDTANLAAANATFGAGLYPHYIGRGESFRLATASAMEQPLRRLWQRYQEFWRSVFRDLVNLVLDQAERYGDKDFPEAERDIDSSMDALLDVDVAQYATAVAGLANYLPPWLVQELALQALHVPNADDVLERINEEAEAKASEEQKAPPTVPAAPAGSEAGPGAQAQEPEAPGNGQEPSAEQAPKQVPVAAVEREPRAIDYPEWVETVEAALEVLEDDLEGKDGEGSAARTQAAVTLLGRLGRGHR